MKENEQNNIHTPEMNNNINVQREEEEGNYLKINAKNQFEIYNQEESSKKLNDIIDYIQELLEEEQNSTNSVWKKILNKLFPKCRCEGFMISKLISKLFSKKLTKGLVESKLNYYEQKRVEITYNKKLVLNKENIDNIGYILCYSYCKFDNFKIYSNDLLKKAIKVGKTRNVLADFYQDCNKRRKSPLDTKMFDFLENNTNKYEAPGILIFLLNCFESLNVIEIDMDLNMNKHESSDDFYLFIITLLNIHHLVTEANHFKVNFINSYLQKDIFLFFTNELNSIYDNNNRYLKKNKKNYGRSAYKKRWDFENDYIIMTKKLNQEKNDELNSDEENDDEKLIRKSLVSASSNFYKENNMLSSETETPDDFVQVTKSMVQNKNNEIDNKKISENDKYDDIVNKNKKILELCCIVILGILRVKKFKNFDLILNDCYYKEYINSFGRNYSSHKLPSSINNFHILNFFIKKMKELNDFNIEFNSLDYLTFYKLLSLIKSNEKLVSFQISFFSSLITYTPQYLYKLYIQNLDKKEICNSKINSPETYLLNELLPYFAENLEVLFELIRERVTTFEILSFNFDIPEIIAINQRYLMVILKFILNILFFVDNKNSSIKKLVILSPKTKMDSRHMLKVENIINSISMDENNKKINEISLQFQFYQINNLKNFVSSNLTILKLGDMDIFTLKKLTRYLCSYRFFKTSKLRNLTVGILYFITEFNKEINFLFNEIFSIKIKTLLEINIYSNILIKEQNDFYKILKHNWISSCNLFLNEKCENFWKQNIPKKKNNKIVDKKVMYLLHHELESEKLTKNDIILKQKKNLVQTDCEVALYLRYLLIFKYSKEKKFKLSYYDQKNIIFNILKYLYFTKTANVEYKYNK